MKKIIALALALGLSFSALTGCGAKKEETKQPADTTQTQTEQAAETKEEATTESALADGTYKAEGDAFDDHGWKPIITLEVKDGKIVAVDYDEINEEGTLKETNEEYNNNMKAKVNIGPAEAFPQLEQALIEKQDVDAVDTVTGATHGSESFKEMVKKALAAGPVAADAAGALKDGTYTAEGEADERGWKPVITIEVKDGKIAAVDYDEVNEEGASKQADEDYNKRMKEKVNIGPAEAFPQLEAALVEKQDVDAVDAVTGATHGSESFKEMAKKALEAAK
ncbi:MAG: FMN-binding protein [Epulopiscium sp.]|nr:FMN-binding protein [Candidatus Epulonipiscium sp.]